MFHFAPLGPNYFNVAIAFAAVGSKVAIYSELWSCEVYGYFFAKAHLGIIADACGYVDTVNRIRAVIGFETLKGRRRRIRARKRKRTSRKAKAKYCRHGNYQSDGKYFLFV